MQLLLLLHLLNNKDFIIIFRNNFLQEIVKKLNRRLWAYFRLLVIYIATQQRGLLIHGGNHITF